VKGRGSGAVNSWSHQASGLTYLSPAVFLEVGTLLSRFVTWNHPDHKCIPGGCPAPLARLGLDSAVKFGT
jgi:hypothetical protein